MNATQSEANAAEPAMKIEIGPGEPTKYRHDWQDALREAYFPLDIKSMSDSNRQSIVYANDLPNLRIGGVSCGAMRIDHLQEHAATGEGGDYFHIPMPLMNPIRLSQRGREAIVRPGDLAVISTSDRYEYEQPMENRLFTLRIDGSVLRQLNQSIDDCTAITFSNEIPEVRLLMSYSQALGNVATDLSREAAGPAVNAFLDMLALALHAGMVGHGEVSAVRSMHAKRVLDMIEARYQDPDFGVGDIADEFGFTPRYLQRIFQERCQTITDVVRQRRLVAAKRMLGNPVHRGLPVAQIAYRSGFGNATHFSRLFRDQFGQTPKEYRDMMLT